MLSITSPWASGSPCQQKKGHNRPSSAFMRSAGRSWPSCLTSEYKMKRVTRVNRPAISRSLERNSENHGGGFRTFKVEFVSASRFRFLSTESKGMRQSISPQGVPADEGGIDKDMGSTRSGRTWVTPVGFLMLHNWHEASSDLKLISNNTMQRRELSP